MQTFQIQLLEQQVRRKQESLAKMDDHILQQLARQQLLEELCQSSPSVTSRSALSQSSISSNNESNTSISSSFLQQEIDRVHQYCRKHQITSQTGETHEVTKETNNTRQHLPLPHQYNNRTKLQQNDQYSSFFKQTTKHEEIDLQLTRKEYLKTISKQEQEDKDLQMREFLEQKDRIRQKQLQEQRHKIRQQLIQQQQNSTKTKQQSIRIFKKQQSLMASNCPDSNCLKIERTKALSHLLHQVQKGKQRTSALLTKTRTFSHY